MWGELSWGEFSLGRVVLGRLVFGATCPDPRPIYSILEYYYFDVKFYNFPVFRNYFYCLSNFSLLFQECSIVNTLVGHLVSLTT